MGLQSIEGRMADSMRCLVGPADSDFADHQRTLPAATPTLYQRWVRKTGDAIIYRAGLENRERGPIATSTDGLPFRSSS